MRKINHLVLHCSATKKGARVTAADIEKWHRQRGFKKIGYHFIVETDGKISKGRPVSETGAHVAGHNADSIGICYVGGLDEAGNPADTRTEAQKAAIWFLLEKLREEYPAARICGHRDFSPDIDGNGVIEPWEYIKACPCFDALTEYAAI